jgi:GNAT superfamily N-acetyltransferase
MSAADLAVRRATEADDPQILTLLQASLGWVPDEQYARFYEWKHRMSPLGPSPAWVATDGDRIVGFRVLLPWEYERDGTIVRAVRAVDTATHPDHQGRGVFSRLTLQAIDELRTMGVGFVFNTPNEKSRPGYLKMGWQPVGRVPVRFRPRGAASLLRMARAKTASEKWSEDTTVAAPASEVLIDGEQLRGLLASQPDAGSCLRTRRTPAYLAWRYGFAPLGYRAHLAGDTLDDGVIVFRLRRRGPALEAAVCEVLAPGGDRRTARQLLRWVARSSGADYLIATGLPGQPSAGLLPAPRLGPILVWRAVCDTDMPPLDTWALSLGDVELF